MKALNRSGVFKMLMGSIMTIVMILSLFAGIGAIWVSEETDLASADSAIYDGSKFIAPGKSGTKGSSTNPYFVLEIVPDESMAQFGYLIGGQEPVDLTELADDAAATSYLNKWIEASPRKAKRLEFEENKSTDLEWE